MTATAPRIEAYEPQAPAFHHPPQKIAPDTYVIRQLQGEGTAPLAVYINSMVILGKEPVIVDVGTEANRRQWLDDVFSLIEPDAVRWVFISHDDHDHTGNLKEVLALCPNATLVSSWFQVERLACSFNLPLHRMRWVDDGGSFDAGDRVLAAVRPPAYDSPTTRGLFDPRTGVYWASDCFAVPVPGPADDIAELEPESWRQGLKMFQQALMPWLPLVDAVRYNAAIAKLNELDIRVIASGHSPVVRGDYVEKAIDLLYELPSAPPLELPGQAELEAMLAAMTAHP